MSVGYGTQCWFDSNRGQTVLRRAVVKIWKPYFDDCNGVKVPGKVLVQAETKEAAEEKMQYQLQNSPIAAWLVPNQYAFHLSHCEELKFDSNDLHLMG